MSDTQTVPTLEQVESSVQSLRAVYGDPQGNHLFSHGDVQVLLQWFEAYRAERQRKRLPGTPSLDELHRSYGAMRRAELQFLLEPGEQAWETFQDIFAMRRDWLTALVEACPSCGSKGTEIAIQASPSKENA
jgi:hypothetical protein